MWLLFAFLGPICWAASTHIDKYLVVKYFKNASTTVLMVFTAFIGFCMLPFILYFQPSVLYIPLGGILVMIASGILYMGATLFYLQAIQSDEASVVAPLFQMSILFTFLLGYILLGETLTPINGFGVACIILAVLLLSFDASFHFRKLKLKLLIAMLICTFMLALSSVIFKLFAISDDFWNTVFWTYFGEAIFGIVILLIPRYFKQFIHLLKTNTGPLLAVNALNEVIFLGAGLSVRFASLFVPVVIISAISSTTTLFIFLFGILLTLFLPKLGRENLSKRNLVQKGIAAALVVIGVALAQII